MDPESHFRAVAPLYMAKLLADFPDLTPMDAAAVFGNAGYESKGLTDDQEDKPLVKGSRGGLNWMQWTGPRRVALEAYCARNNLDPTGDKAAYAWLFLELKGEEKAAIPALKSATSLEDKVRAFERAFLRAAPKTVNYPERIRWAKIALEEISRPQVRPDPPIPVTKPDSLKPSPPAGPAKHGTNWLFWIIVAALLALGIFILFFVRF